MPGIKLSAKAITGVQESTVSTIVEFTFWCRRHRPILSQVIKRNERMLGATPGLVGRSGGLTGGPKR